MIRSLVLGEAQVRGLVLVLSPMTWIITSGNPHINYFVCIFDMFQVFAFSFNTNGFDTSGEKIGKDYLVAFLNSIETTFIKPDVDRIEALIFGSINLCH